MASASAVTTSSVGAQTQSKRTSLSGFNGTNASILLEKAKAGIRRSTPDSEALASSDDEQDQHHHISSNTSSQIPRSLRSSSWRTEVQQASQRKSSITSNSGFAAAGSHPSPPGADPWNSGMSTSSGSTVGRNHSNNSSFPWGNAIWNNELQKGPPSRLTEVLPSPTSLAPSLSTPSYGDEALRSPPLRRDSTTSAIPFAIPLHPTPKTYRSQSYSVGQLDPELMNNGPPAHSQHAHQGRTRAGSSYAGLQHRPSRPSMLGDFSHDTSVLGQLREVDDDDEGSSVSSEAGVHVTSTQQRTIEKLALENAMLRQAAATSQMQNMHMPSATYGTNTTHTALAAYDGRSLQQQMSDSVLEEPEESLNDLDELGISQGFSRPGNNVRRYSEYNANAGAQLSTIGIPENRKIESIKKGFWQSSLGFGGMPEIPQSRRHSFADIPTRHGSMSSVGDSQGGVGGLGEVSPQLNDLRALSGSSEALSRPQGENSEYAHFRLSSTLAENKLEQDHLRDRDFAASYFSSMDPSLRNPPFDSPLSTHPNYGMQAPYGRMHHLAHNHQHHGQKLYVVTFKACRAEFYYVQEGTGLQVKAGDLVIVEADRGTDLGTVAHENVDWAAAKGLKEHYVAEHYRWLMMFSRHGQSSSGAPADLGRNTTPTSAIDRHAGFHSGSGMVGQSAPVDSVNVEIKPKMIKRLAQAHEIQTLRDKEGNEAKAKRMCQQKVVEHHLNMEILDAEFQMDWKKLTFYYFADSYINFNSLVTDLFKIYKTRIWMSAINPASFVTPSAGLHMSSGGGPVGSSHDHEHFVDGRIHKENLGFVPAPLAQVNPTGLPPNWNTMVDSSMPLSIIPNIYTNTYPKQGLQADSPDLQEHVRGLHQNMRSTSPFNSQVYGTYSGGQQHMYSKPDAKTSLSRNTYLDPLNGWSTHFQGLSLGS